MRGQGRQSVWVGMTRGLGLVLVGEQGSGFHVASVGT